MRNLVLAMWIVSLFVGFGAHAQMKHRLSWATLKGEYGTNNERLRIFGEFQYFMNVNREAPLVVFDGDSDEASALIEATKAHSNNIQFIDLDYGRGASNLTDQVKSYANTPEWKNMNIVAVHIPEDIKSVYLRGLARLARTLNKDFEEFGVRTKVLVLVGRKTQVDPESLRDRLVTIIKINTRCESQLVGASTVALGGLRPVGLRQNKDEK